MRDDHYFKYSQPLLDFCHVIPIGRLLFMMKKAIYRKIVHIRNF